MTKREMKAAVRAAKRQGKTVRVFLHQGLYCQPGKGLATYVYYTVEVK